MDIDLTVHGDDFLVVAGKKALNWLKQKMCKTFEAKVGILGPDADEEKQVKILNRILTWAKDGILYEADQRHAEMVVSELGLKKSKINNVSKLFWIEEFNVR